MTHAPSRSRGAPALMGATGPSLRWRLVASSWLVTLLIGSGGFAWVGFGILALAAPKRSSWALAFCGYLVGAILAFQWEDPVGHYLQGTLFLVALLHGLIINQSWLLLLWGRHENGLTVFGHKRVAPTSGGRGRQRSAPIPTEAEELLSGAGTSRSDYVDDSAPDAARASASASASAAVSGRTGKPRTRAQRRAQEKAAAERAKNATTRPEPVVEPAAEPVAEAEPLDVNTANQRALARLTGMDRARAKTVIAERTKRGGFSSLDDFAATAGLQPHQIVRLRGEAFCSARPRAPRSFGRRVDY